MNQDARPLFHEEQSFRLRRLPLLLAIPPVSMSLLLIWQVGLGHPWGTQPLSSGSVIGWTIFLWLVYFRLVTVRLVTEVRPGEVSIAMRGFWRERHIPLSDIQVAQPVTFDAARDWGGYGIRTTRHGTAYIAGGNRGVRLKLVKGGGILIGSERADELASAINHRASSVSST
jgi:hypothetical protein